MKGMGLAQYSLKGNSDLPTQEDANTEVVLLGFFGSSRKIFNFVQS